MTAHPVDSYLCWERAPLEPAMTRAERCALRMDAVVPEWPRLVDTDHLDITNPKRCVGAYVFGSYAEALRRLDIADPVAWGLHPVRVVLFGGTATEDEALEDAGALTEAWCALVRERRGNAARFAQVRGGVTRG